MGEHGQRQAFKPLKWHCFLSADFFLRQARRPGRDSRVAQLLPSGAGQGARCTLPGRARQPRPRLQSPLPSALPLPCLCPASALQALAVLAVYPLPGRPWARQALARQALAGLPLAQQARPRQLSTLPSLSRLRACARPAEGVPPASRHHGLSPACFLCGAGTGRREARSLAGLSLPCPQAGWPLESHADINVKKTVRSKREPCQKDSHVKKIDASPEPSAPHVQKMDTAHTCLTPCG